MEKAAEFLEIRKVKKNQYFLHEGEPTGFFAGVIKGKVSIRKTHIFDKKSNQIVIKPLYKIIMIKKPSLGRSSRRMSSNAMFLKNSQDNDNSLDNRNIKNINNKIDKKDSFKKVSFLKKNSKTNFKKTFQKMKSSKITFGNSDERNNNFRIIKEIFDPEKYIVSEEELFRQGEGYCFGEWALIYREPRSASIYTLEDCVFFTLDEIHFKNSFLKSLNNSEYSKKKFALQNFLPFDMMDERQLSIYKNIVPITCKRNEIIFNEGDTSDSIYLIYLGSFTLEKKYGIKQFRVLNLERGSIVGLESIFEGEDSKYKCSLKLSCGFDVGLIFQLRINKLRPYIVNKMRVSFKTNYIVFLKSLNDLYNKNIFILQKMNKEKFEENNGEEGKNDFADLLSENDENVEYNGELFNKNWNSVLNIEPEDKYELLFKECLKKKLYDNHKKDGSLRIFSSKQKNKISEPTTNNNNNSNNLNINIIKYFKNNAKSDMEGINPKTTNSFWTKKLNNLNINEGTQSNRINEAIKQGKKKLNLTEIKKNNVLIEDNEEMGNKISFNDEESIFNNKEKIKKKKNNFNLKTKPLKINKNLLYDTNIIKDNIKNKSVKNNKYITIHFKNSLINNKKYFIQKDFSIINKLNKNIENKKEKKIKNQNSFKRNLSSKKLKNVPTLREYINDKNSLSRNNSLIQNNKNSSIEKNSFNNNNLNINSPISNVKEDKSLFQKINTSNPIKLNQKKQLFNIPLISGRESKKIKFSYEKDFKKAKNINFSNKKYCSIEQNHLTPLSLRTNKLVITFDKENNKSTNTINNNNKKYKIFNKDKIYQYIKNNNFTQRSKKVKKTINVDEHKNIYQELNLNNGFSVSYFEKINPINNINNFELTSKNRPFPSSLNPFKVSFDSGVFKIPLISSSIRIRKRIED